jgi:hypothetical protein
MRLTDLLRNRISSRDAQHTSFYSPALIQGKKVQDAVAVGDKAVAVVLFGQ